MFLLGSRIINIYSKDRAFTLCKTCKFLLHNFAEIMSKFILLLALNSHSIINDVQSGSYFKQMVSPHAAIIMSILAVSL